MKKSLIIVESPAKVKTLKKFLGDDYIIESSVGHVRDLPEKEFGIDIENDFEPKYVVMPNKQEVINKLKSAAQKSDVVYLALDPDREGEAIAWQIAEILPPDTNKKRVAFNEIRKEAVLKALENPRNIDISLVNAQQARRLLDRIVGYKISPLLNRRIQRGRDNAVSAGRVQSVALKLVVLREKEIAAFKPVEYWNLGAIFKTQPNEKAFKSTLFSIDGKKVEKEAADGKDYALISDKETADKIIQRMKAGPYVVERVERKEKKRNPVPPFITSTLQQEASRHYGFSSSRTMAIAQGLYEGVDMGSEGTEGLITYMRTDSVRISPDAIQEARQYINQLYGKDYIPESAKVYASQKSAQDAHEAIRPTNLAHSPENIKDHLSREQFLLYQLIWRRYLASQMTPAIYDTVSVDIEAEKGILLRATGSIIKFPGFLAIYEEKEDDNDGNDEGKVLPHIEINQHLLLQELLQEQTFTRPPPRYTEASLVKELEKSGIGRPSTYATIMNKIQSREYTVKENGRLKPTEVGQVIAELLEANFEQIMDVGFTASMEDDLERVAESKKDWKELIKEFWDQFNPTLEKALKEAFVPKIMTEIECPKCHEGKLQKIWSKSKYFYGCARYPECDYSAPIEEVVFNKEDYDPDFDWDQVCLKCQSPMKVRHGRFGSFLGCTRYPECKGIVNIPKKGESIPSQDNLPSCPAIGCSGSIVARKSRFGKIFYSCSTFPDCDVIVNQLDDLESKYKTHPKTAYQKKEKASRKGVKAKKAETSATPKKTAKKTSTKVSTKTPKEKVAKVERKMPSYLPSTELGAVIGKEPVTRGGMMKKIWDYIKSKDLQDSKNKRLIVPDQALTKLFGSNEPMDMFKMTKVLSGHLNKNEENGA